MINKKKYCIIALVFTIFYSIGITLLQLNNIAGNKEIKEQKNIEELNKEVVTQGIKKLFGEHDLSALNTYWGDTYIQHNPMAADGKESLRAFIEQMIESGMKPQPIEFARISAEDDLVWVHYKINFMGQDMAVVDILRLEDGKMVEHWDVLQAVPETSANDNTMF